MVDFEPLRSALRQDLAYYDGQASHYFEYLPNTLTVAHKVGVAGKGVQSDCGVVCNSNRNHLLNVMLSENKESGSEVITQVLKKVYDLRSR